MGVILPPMKISNFVQPAISKLPNTPLRTLHQYSSSNNLILTGLSFIHTSNSNSWSGTSRATTPSPPPPPPPPPPPESDSTSSAGVAMTLSRIKDTAHVFVAVLFWMSVFFWASAWDGRDNGRSDKGPRF